MNLTIKERINFMMNTVCADYQTIDDSSSFKLKHNLSVLGQLSANPSLKIYVSSAGCMDIDNRFGQTALRKVEKASQQVFELIKRTWANVFSLKKEEQAVWGTLVEDAYLGTRTFQKTYQHEIPTFNEWMGRTHTKLVKEWEDSLDPNFVANNLWQPSLEDTQFTMLMDEQKNT